MASSSRSSLAVRARLGQAYVYGKRQFAASESRRSYNLGLHWIAVSNSSAIAGRCRLSKLLPKARRTRRLSFAHDQSKLHHSGRHVRRPLIFKVGQIDAAIGPRSLGARLRAPKAIIREAVHQTAQGDLGAILRGDPREPVGPLAGADPTANADHDESVVGETILLIHACSRRERGKDCSLYVLVCQGGDFG